MAKTARLLFIASISAGLIYSIVSRPPHSENIPVDRLIQNVEAYVSGHPGVSRGHYTLARLHYLAFAMRSDLIRTYPQWRENDDLPGLGEQIHPGKADYPLIGGRKIEMEEALRHLIAAASGIETALQLDPDEALYHLTSACIREDGSGFAPAVKQEDTPAGWIERAIAEYRKAHELAWRVDSLRSYGPLEGFRTLVSYEAGQSYIRLTKARGLVPGEKQIIAGIEAHLEKLSSLHSLRRGVSPIVLALTPHASLSELLDPEIQVGFDLDGTGRDQKWPWLKADTGILVWDPKRAGVIESGRQLFGTVTWWMFWENGYDALATLDDNHDGWLTGRELDGLALWFDRNQNGHSDAGEVIPIEQFGIVAIRVEWDGREGASWRSAKGVRLRDGSFLPTWDWVVKPVPSTLGKELISAR